MSLEAIIGALAKGFWGVVSAVLASILGWMGWSARQDKKLLRDHQDAITKLKALAVDETKVREIIKEEIHPVSEDVREIKNLISANTKIMNGISIEIAEQRGYNQAQRNKDREAS